MKSPPSAERAAGSAWSPLRIAAFRALWLAQLGSMIGTWMQTVGAQWLLVDDPNAATLVSLVQTASLLPMLLLALPAGALADSFDRRRLLIGVQLLTFVTGVVLTGLSLAGDLHAGAAAHLHVPARRRRGRHHAALAGAHPGHGAPPRGAGGRRARRGEHEPGPRGRAGAGRVPRHPVPGGVVFAVNAASYAVMAVVLLRWGPRSRVSGEVPERFVPALRAGARYVRHSRVVRRLLLRSALFVLPGTALWALLPLVATQRLGLGSGGYGLLLAALGIGAVAGAVVLPRVAERLSTGLMVFLASVVYAAAQLGVVLVDSLPLVVVLLLPGGSGLARGALHPRRGHAGLPARLGPGPRAVGAADRVHGRAGRRRPRLGARRAVHRPRPRVRRRVGRSWRWARPRSRCCRCTTPPA